MIRIGSIAEIFKKEFPTYTRGFIGAVEDEG